MNITIIYNSAACVYIGEGRARRGVHYAAADSAPVVG